MEFPLTFGLQKAGLPLILMSGKTNNLCFLIDTGATHNTLFDFVYEHFKSEFKLLEGAYRTMGIEGHYKETPIIEATFNFEQIHGVLGVQFLIENKWIIDFNKYQIHD